MVDKTFIKAPLRIFGQHFVETHLHIALGSNATNYSSYKKKRKYKRRKFLASKVFISNFALFLSKKLPYLAQ
jgi:hypothetical protein